MPTARRGKVPPHPNEYELEPQISADKLEPQIHADRHR